MGTRWISWAAVVFALHFVWEMTQGRWYVGMNELPFARALDLCTRATLGDLVITATAFATAALTRKDFTWPARRRVALPATVFVLAGLAITIAYERVALAEGRWQYKPRMPVILDIGVAPVLQWVLLPLVEIAVFRAIWRSS